MKRRFFCIFSLAIAWTAAHGFTIGIPASIYDTEVQPQVEQAFEQLYAHIGEPVSFHYSPFSRLQRMAEQRQIDAIGYLTEAPQTDTLVRVTEPLTQISLQVRCLDADTCHFTPDARFAVVQDATHALKLCEQLMLRCTTVSSPELAIKALQDRLADMHLIQHSPDIERSCPDVERLYIREIAKSRVNIYHYLTVEFAPHTVSLAARIKALRKQRQTQSHACECNDVHLEPIDLTALLLLSSNL